VLVGVTPTQQEGTFVATIGTGFTGRPSRPNRQPIVLVKVPLG
jgi:hypothetical protein